MINQITNSLHINDEKLSLSLQRRSMIKDMADNPVGLVIGTTTSWVVVVDFTAQDNTYTSLPLILQWLEVVWFTEIELTVTSEFDGQPVY